MQDLGSTEVLLQGTWDEIKGGFNYLYFLLGGSFLDAADPICGWHWSWCFSSQWFMLWDEDVSYFLTRVNTTHVFFFFYTGLLVNSTLSNSLPWRQCRIRPAVVCGWQLACGSCFCCCGCGAVMLPALEIILMIVILLCDFSSPIRFKKRKRKTNPQLLNNSLAKNTASPQSAWNLPCSFMCNTL